MPETIQTVDQLIGMAETDSGRQVKRRAVLMRYLYFFVRAFIDVENKRELPERESVLKGIIHFKMVTRKGIVRDPIIKITLPFN